MKLWVGHILEKPKEWFLVWAKTKSEAIYIVDATFGEPDIRSLLSVDLPGCLSLIVNNSEENEEESNIFLIPNCEDEFILERNNKPKIEDWVEYCVNIPLGPANRVDTSYLAQQMRITQPEVLDAYNFQKCPKCESRDYSETKGCLSCHYSKR